MSREFAFTRPSRRRPAGQTDPDQYDGVEIGVVSRHLKSGPIDNVRLPDHEALAIAEELVRLVRCRMRDA